MRRFDRKQTLFWLGSAFFCTFLCCGTGELPPIQRIGQSEFTRLPGLCNQSAYGPAVFSKDGRFVAVQCSPWNDQPFIVELWEAAGTEQPAPLARIQDEQNHGFVYSFAFHPYSSEVLLGTTRGPIIRKLSNDASNPFKEIQGIESIETPAVTYSSDGSKVALFQKSTIFIIDRVQKKILARYTGQNLPIRELVFSPDEKKLFALPSYSSSMDDRALSIFTLEAGRKEIRLPASQQKPDALKFVKYNDGYLATLIMIGGPIKIDVLYERSEIETEVLRTNVYLISSQNNLNASPAQIAYSPDGKYFTISQSRFFAPEGSGLPSKPSIYLSKFFWGATEDIERLKDFTQRLPVQAYANASETSFLGVSFTPDGRQLLAITEAGIYRWDLVRE